ncbi:MAG TPA: hypothetical protein DF637_02770 [Rikenellaceae bacterium]|nr:hypothetical protein [Rikenellaceae bacterium]
MTGFSQETGDGYSLKNRFSFEYNSGFSYLIDVPEIFEINLGMGADGIIGFDAYKNIGVFAGWGFNSFNNEYLYLDESGIMYGFQYKNVIHESRFSYIIRAGAIYNQLKLKGSKDSFFKEFSYDSGHSHGFHASGALEFDMRRGWAIRGSVKYHQFKKTVSLPFSEIFPSIRITACNVDLKYAGVRLGIVKNF